MTGHDTGADRVDTARVFVAVGTDHHRFDRLTRWIDSWMASTETVASVFVQYGTSTPPALAEGADYLAHAELARHMSNADVAVTHGGPGTIMDARRSGVMPIVVPRRPDLGEHVDDHQVRFSVRMASLGEIELAEDEAGLAELIESMIADPRRAQVPDDGHVAEAVQTFGSAVDELVRGPAPHGSHVDPCSESVMPEEPTTDSSPPTVLFIGGVGRSGSTLLAGMLDQHPGAQQVGELGFAFDRGVLDDELCECGLRFSACPFWQSVGQKAFGGWDRALAERFVALQHSVDRTRWVPMMVAPHALDRAYNARLDEYTDVLGRLYSAVRDVSGADVIVDSTKHASYAYVLRHVPGISFRTVHLVRDSRGVAFSWTRQRVRTEIVDRTELMPRFGPARVALRWDSQNLLFGALGRLGVPTLRVRYEDLVTHPAETLRRVHGAAGLPSEAGPEFVNGNEIELQRGHSIGGNPSRFENGPRPVRVDDAWKREMRSRDRRLVTSLTWPLMRSYGYDR